MGFTVCPVSNHYVVQSMTTDEIRRMLDHGLLVTLNSDDPSYFQSYLVDNFERTQAEAGFDLETMKTLIGNGFRVAWIDDAARGAYLAQVEAHFA